MARLNVALLSDFQAPESDDTFFVDAGEHGLVATYDFDYGLIESFNKQLRWAGFILAPPAWLSCCFCVPCFLNKNIEWDARSQHVALTIDGIKYVRNKRKSGCGFTCQDKGKESKTIPYDKITDCDVQEPAGTACLCCIQNVLTEVTVDTASSGGAGLNHELSLKGLRHANEFKTAVWAMKRKHDEKSEMNGGGPAHAPGQESMEIKLLTEIRDELRKMNANSR